MPRNVKARSKKRRQLLPPLALVLVVLLIVGAVVLIHHHRHQVATKQTATSTSSVKPQNTVDYSPATPSDNANNEGRKDSTSDTQTLTQSTPSNSAPTDTVDVTITNAKAENDSSGNKVVHVGNIVSGVTSGSCTLTATKAGQTTITNNSSVQLDGNSYDCGAFNIPASSFPSSGTWNLKLNVTSGSQSGYGLSTVTL